MEMDDETESKYSYLGNKLKKEDSKGKFLVPIRYPFQLGFIT